MSLGKVGYYGEFVVYPVVIVVLAAVVLWRASPERGAIGLAAFVAGVGLSQQLAHAGSA